MNKTNMFRKYYHCLIAGLPDIFLDETELSFSLLEFKRDLKHELYPKDYELAQMLFLHYDNMNLLNFLQEKYDAFDKLGNFTAETLEQEMDSEERLYVLPDYMYSFMEAYREKKKDKSLKEWENEITQRYFNYLLNSSSEFLRKWYTFEMNVTNLVTGINCRKFDRDPENELIGNNFVTEAIKRSSAKDFGLEVELEYAGEVIHIAERENLLTREKGLDQFKWDMLNELTLFHYFSIEVVLAYILKLKMIYRWMSLDEKTGRKMFEKLIEELKDSFEFTKDFMINEQRR